MEQWKIALPSKSSIKSGFLPGFTRHYQVKVGNGYMLITNHYQGRLVMPGKTGNFKLNQKVMRYQAVKKNQKTNYLKLLKKIFNVNVKLPSNL